MTAIDTSLLEQLSAWMDGELPADEARFLQRRLHNDTALREQWERWQVASACLHGHPVRRMDADLPGRIAAGIAEAANDPPAHRPKMAWLASAAAVVLAVALVPRMLAVDPARTLPGDAPSPVASVPARPPVSPVSPAPALASDPVPAMSPLPSVRDFPLVDNGGKAWPRSPLLVGPRVRDGLLVRNELPWMAPIDAGRPLAPSADDAEREAGNE
jgi:hypothetical protein